MKAVASVLLVLTLVPLSACGPKVNDPAEVQAVKQTMETYAKASSPRTPGFGRNDDGQDSLLRAALPSDDWQGRGREVSHDGLRAVRR